MNVSNEIYREVERVKHATVLFFFEKDKDKSALQVDIFSYSSILPYILTSTHFHSVILMGANYAKIYTYK